MQIDQHKILYTKVIITVNTPIKSAFNYIVPVDLTHIFKRYKQFPAIIETSIKEKWIKPGLTRTIYFEDGTTARETLVTVIPDTSFSYKIENFTSQLRFLAKRIEGNWTFKETEPGYTKIVWIYKLIPHNFVTGWIIRLILLKSLNGLLTNALTTLRDDLESGDFEK